MTRTGNLSRAGPGSLSAVSRRRFFGVTAAAAGVTLGSSLWTPARSDPGEGEPSSGAPDPIPHANAAPPAAFGAFHFFFPGPVDGSAAPTDPEGVHPAGRDPSTIFDFDGVIGQADLDLSGTGTDTTTGASDHYTFHTDMRFMAGKFLATDGRVHKGAFAFI
jgi:hypothetical protein